jgi:hypothetical protein
MERIRDQKFEKKLISGSVDITSLYKWKSNSGRSY